MYKKSTDSFVYTVVDDVDHIIDEKGNKFLALRKLYWNDNEDSAKLDLRLYYNTANGEERPGKGISFITEEGPNNLTHTLLGMGYGNTQRVLEAIKDRNDFRSSLNNILDENDQYYDRTVSQNLYVPGSDLLDYDEED